MDAKFESDASRTKLSSNFAANVRPPEKELHSSLASGNLWLSVSILSFTWLPGC